MHAVIDVEDRRRPPRDFGSRALRRWQADTSGLWRDHGATRPPRFFSLLLEVLNVGSEIVIKLGEERFSDFSNFFDNRVVFHGNSLS